MTEFSTEATLSFSDSSLKGAAKQLERELGGVSVGVETGGTTARRMNSGSGGGLGSSAASTAVGTKLSGMSGSLEETIELDQERNTVLSELLEATERNAGSGGGGSGIGSLLSIGGVASMLGGFSISSMLGSVSLGSLVTKASFKSLLKKTPALATLVTAASLTDDLIDGTLGPDDLVDSAISIGELMTFDMLGNDLIEGAIGTVTLSYGTIQIANLIGGTLASSKLLTMFGGSGSLGIGSLIGGTLGRSTLLSMFGGVGSLSIGAVLAPLTGGAIAAYLGSVGIEKLIDKYDDGEQSYDQETSKTSAGTDGANQGEIDFDSLEGVDAPDTSNVSSDPLSPEEADNLVQSVDPDSPVIEEEQGSQGSGTQDSSGSQDSSGTQPSSNKPNQARQNTSRPPQVDYTANYDLTAIDSLERKVDQDMREIKRRLKDLERSFDG